MTDIDNELEVFNKDSLTTIDVNVMPAKTWYWLGVNDAKLTWDTDDEAELDKLDIVVGAGQKASDVLIDFADVTRVFNKKQINITAEAGSEITVIAHLDKKENVRAFFSIDIKEGASVRLIEICKVAENSIYSEIKTNCGKEAKFELIHAFAGTRLTPVKLNLGEIYSDVRVDLVGDRSEFVYNMGYLACGCENFDYNIVVNHIGKKTNCDICANGALMDMAHKVFRGTIDFKTGSSGSVGAETETVLMLGDEVVNKTVPVILCSEEDVSGTHGASIGELDDETLFYFESRGIDKKLAESIMARAAIERLIGIADNEQAAEIISNTLEEVLGDD